MEEDKRSGHKEGLWLKVFCPSARCLSEEEIMSLPREKVKSAEKEGKGLWLEIFCPDESCLSEEERTFTPVKDERQGKSGFWLNLFCPEDRCVADQGTDLP